MMGFRQITLSLILVLAAPAQAELFYPEFESLDAAFSDVHYLAGVGFRPEGQIKKFRIKIFPHFGAYPIPQGRETTATAVTVAADQVCKEFEARLDENQEWVPVGPSLRELRKVRILAAKKVSRYYQCPGKFTVYRGSGLESISYRGDFVSVADGALEVSLIHLVHPEDYIKGVIPSEVYTTWPAEVLKAQAVAARTYAWFSAQVARKFRQQLDQSIVLSPLYDMDDTVQYQAYMGISKLVDSTNAATDATRGLVMRHEGQVIKSYFSADSGGATESSLNGFGHELPYCISRPELYDSELDQSHWVRSNGVTDVQTRLVSRKVLEPGFTLRSLKLTRVSASGRVTEVELTDNQGKKKILTGAQFRYGMALRSTLFQVSRSGAIYRFSGRGYGHGVGMAQMGALRYATYMNWDYETILKFYYSGVSLVNELQ